MSGAGCADNLQCVMTLRESSTVEECCNKIVESVTTNAPASGLSSNICGDHQTQFGDRQDIINFASLRSEIRAGTYIVPQSGPRFIYSCSGCIKSIQLAVSPTSQLKDAQGQERINFHTFTEKSSNIFQRREDVAVWNSSVVSTAVDRKVVEYSPIGLAEVCFSQDDIFGFTIEAGSDVAILARVPSDSNHLLLNTSRASETISGCPQLSNIDLYTSTANFSLAPLIHINVTGKISAIYSSQYTKINFVGDFPPTKPPDEPSTTEPITAADGSTASPRTTTTAPNEPTPDPTDDVQPPTGVLPPDSSGYVIYAAGGFAGAICILLIIVIIITVICIIQRRNHRRYQYGNGFDFGSPSELFSQVEKTSESSLMPSPFQVLVLHMKLLFILLHD